MPRGGKRPGAGKKKGMKHKKTLEQEMMRQRLKELVNKKLDILVKAQLEKAEGIKLETIIQGKVVYKDPGPDTFAFKTLIEHAIGKPKETIEVNKPEFLFDLEEDKDGN